MQVAVRLISESRLNVPEFAQISKAITQQNHVGRVDANPRSSQLANDIAILDDFSGNESELSQSVTFLTFIFAGWNHDIQEIIEHARGLPHLTTQLAPEATRCCIVSGSVSQWKNTVIEGCSAHPLSTARYAFNQIYQIMCGRGLKYIFGDVVKIDQPDKTFLLKSK